MKTGTRYPDRVSLPATVRTFPPRCLADFQSVPRSPPTPGTGSPLSQKLALFPLNLADSAETLAYGVILLLVLAIGFALAWLIQTVRRQHAVCQLIERQLEDERAQIEESRLLAEDTLQEQATLIAQQDRRIEHLKTRLARQIAQQQASTGSPPSANPGNSTTTIRTPSTPSTAIRQTRTAHRAPRSESPPRREHLIDQTVEMAARAAAIHRSRLASHMTAVPRPGQPVHAPATRTTPPQERQRPADSRPPQHRHPEQARVAAQARQQERAPDNAADHEKARLLRRYEHDAAQWQQAWQRSEARRARLQHTIETLEKQLQESRERRARAESELQRLREQFQQQQALNLMDGVDLARKATSFRLHNTIHYPDSPGMRAPNTQVHYPHLGHPGPSSGSDSRDGDSRRPS